MVAGVQSTDPTVQLEAVTKFRKLLSIGAAHASRLEPRRKLGERTDATSFLSGQSATRRSAR